MSEEKARSNSRSETNIPNIISADGNAHIRVSSLRTMSLKRVIHGLTTWNLVEESAGTRMYRLRRKINYERDDKLTRKEELYKNADTYDIAR